VTAHREFKIDNSFTLEASFCGPSAAPGVSFRISDYERMGAKLCEALLILNTRVILENSQIAIQSNDFMYQLEA
jgi:hypothetical protein